MNRPLLSGAIAATLLVAAVALPRAGAQEVISARTAAGLGAQAPYRSPRYRAQCRRDARQDTQPAITVESREEARERARAAARAGRLDTTLIFARMAYGETGTPVPGENDDPDTPLVDEYEGFLAVMDHRRGQLSRVEMMVSYGPRRVHPREEDTRSRWLAELELNGHRPPSWPRPRGRRHHSYPTWRFYGCPRWLATVDAAREIMRTYRGRRVGRGPFPEVPHHWGGDMDNDRARRGGWRLLPHRFTNNNFWVVPGDPS